MMSYDDQCDHVHLSSASGYFISYLVLLFFARSLFDGISAPFARLLLRLIFDSQKTI